MDALKVVFGLLGGLGIFLYGMHYMSEGLQRIAGHRLKDLLATLTRNRLMAVGLGLLATALVQSSSATTVTVVGFVNAGLMTLTQAIGVVLGANIGTTVTAWIIGVNITEAAPLFIGVGCFLVLFVASKRWNRIGQVMLGFGFLLFGMLVMKDGVAPLKKHPIVSQTFLSFSTHPLLAIAAGTAMTCLLQSSSATIGLAIVLAQQGLLDFYGAVPLIIGDNIGTTITAQLAALRGTVEARRTAMSHTLFNIFGATWLFPFLIGPQLYQKFIVAVTPLELNNQTVGVFIANSHTCFNVANVLIFLPLMRVLELAAIKLTPDRGRKPRIKFRYLEPQFADNPALAMDMVRLEIGHMLQVARRGVDTAVEGVLADPPLPVADTVGEIEELVDDMQHEITRYLINLSQRDLDHPESDRLPVMLHSVNDIERISDHAFNISQASVHLASKGIRLGEAEKNELRAMFADIGAMFNRVGQALSKKNHQPDTEQKLREALEIETRLDQTKRILRARNIERLQSGETDYLPGMIFLDTVNNFEKIGDHLTNVVEAILRSFQYSGQPPMPEHTATPAAAGEAVAKLPLPR
ncbi:MAG: Na/Pi cotransporter family protein [Candidatus Sumerlaeia bacterium]